MNMTKPLIAITMGDPAGIGPEVCLQLIHDRSTLQQCVPIIFGDADVLSHVAALGEFAPPEQVISIDEWPTRRDAITSAAVLDLAAIDVECVRPGNVSKATGMASYKYIEASITAALEGQVDAVATGPVHKEALHWAGVPYPGHTEIFAAKTQTDRSCMMLTCSALTCSFVTTHVGYRDVPGLLSVQRIVDVIELSHDAILRIHDTPGRLVICGLNPHAGENGLFGGREEEQFIVPAVQAARSKGIQIEGPLPPDTAFLPERRDATDCFVCMYHDQGHIPLKALAFDIAVNVTLGLPIIRTSVDHGTACDIAWQGKADVTSLIQAVALATKLSSANSVAEAK